MSDLDHPEAIRRRAEHCAGHPHRTVARVGRFVLTGERCAELDAPGFDRIAEAIGHVFDTAGVEVVVVRDGAAVADGVDVLARILDKGGVVDWAAFTDDAGDRAPEVDL